MRVGIFLRVSLACFDGRVGTPAELSENRQPNLLYEVRAKPDSNDECVAAIAKMLNTEFKNSTGIIYSLTIKDVETLAEQLNASGLRVAPYHGNLGIEVSAYSDTLYRESRPCLRDKMLPSDLSLNIKLLNMTT